jgi:hypothetical protein
VNSIRRLSNQARSLVLASMALAATAAPAAAQDNPPTHRSFEVWKPHVAKRGDTPVLVHGIASSASRPYWALVEVNNPDGSRKCEWLKLVEPRQRYRFECPLPDATGEKYPSRVRVFANAKLEDREIFYEPVVAVTAEVVAAAPRADAEPASVPEGALEGMDVSLPVTFKPTWYRRVDRGFGMRAYENSGDLTVTADELVFVDGKKTVRIPRAQILSVRWEPLPNDIANHWVVVRFTTDEGKPDGVAFRDGGRLGTRGSTGPIYQAVRRASIK